MQINYFSTNSCINICYQIGKYNQSAKIIKKLYKQNNDDIEIVFRLARSIFLIAEETIDENAVVFSKDEMEQLHRDGKLVKGDSTYIYSED